MPTFISPPAHPQAYGPVDKYEGLQATVTPGPALVWVIRDRTMYDLPLRLDLTNHSPDGFAWGYAGSGPSQLALAILADFTQDDTLALRLYQQFKWAVIAHLKGDSFVLSGTDISAWLERQSRDSSPI